MEEWSKNKLRDFLLIPIRNGLTKPSAIRGQGVKMIGMKEIFAMDRISSVEMDRVPVTDKEYKTSEIQQEDLLFARQSLTLEGAGKCSIVLDVNEPTVFESHLIRLRVDKSKANPYFLYYYFKSPYGRFQIKTLVQQVAAAGIKGKDLVELELLTPSVASQNQIVDILKSYDDKIDCNIKINNRLHNLLQAMFKSWFVDFEPFKNGEFIESELGEIPKGWKVSSLDKILELKRNNIKKGDDTTLPYLPIDIIPMRSLGINGFKPNEEAQSSLQTFDKDDIIIGAMRVYFHRVVVAPQKGITRSTCFVFRPIIPNSVSFCTLLCDTEEAINYANKTSKGSTMPYAVWKGGLDSFKFVLPPQEVICNFENATKEILIHIRDGYKERIMLSNIQDALLPKLMSGELKMPDTDLINEMLEKGIR